MVLRVKPTPTRFPTNSLYTAVDITPLHSILSVCQPGCTPPQRVSPRPIRHAVGPLYTKDVLDSQV